MSRAGKWLNRFVILFVALFTIGFLGCISLQDIATPCVIEPAAAEYAKVKPTSFLPWTTLYDAKRVTLHMDYQHQLKQIELMRDLQDDDLHVTFIRDAHVAHVEAAKEFRDSAFSPESTGSLLASGLGFGTLGALLIKRPGDKSEKQIKAENGNKATT
jgi:hypothetical protein